MYNVLTDKYEPVLFEDGEVREFGGLRLGAINGIVALRRRMRKGIPRKKLEEYIEIAKKLKGKVDILLLHGSPKLLLPEYSFIANDRRAQAIGIAIYEARPKLALCDHLHMSPYTIYKFKYGTFHVRIDSSQKHRAYLILYTGSKKLEVWRDQEVLEEQDL